MRLYELPKNEVCDVIILTNTADEDIFKMTSSAIESLKESEYNNKFRVILVESNPNFDVHKYSADVHLTFNEEFNMNKALNMAFDFIQSDWVYISNNDVLFCENWYSNLRYNMDVFNLDTASPKSPIRQFGVSEAAQEFISKYPDHVVIVGNEVIVHFAGWGWLTKAETLRLLTPFPEDLKFWYQDNHLSLSLKQMGKKHGCVTSSYVCHFGQKSYRTIPMEKMFEMTQGIQQNFVKKWLHLKG